MSEIKSRILLLAALAGTAADANAQPAPASEQVVVYGTLSNADIGLGAAQVAGSLQSLSANDITAGDGA